jgi:hypothetical protein
MVHRSESGNRRIDPVEFADGVTLAEWILETHFAMWSWHLGPSSPFAVAGWPRGPAFARLLRLPLSRGQKEGLATLQMDGKLLVGPTDCVPGGTPP